MRIPRLHKEVSLFSPQTIAATFSRLADSITSIVAGNATYTDPDGVVRESQIGTMVRQTVDNVIIKATATATTAAQGGQSIIQSLINVAPEGVRISAEKVDIEGAAIFTTGKLSKVVTSSQTECSVPHCHHAPDSNDLGSRRSDPLILCWSGLS